MAALRCLGMGTQAARDLVAPGALALALILHTGCAGSITADPLDPEPSGRSSGRETSGVGAGSGDGSASGGGPAPPAGAGECRAAGAGPAPLRRLTRLEYDITVRELLGEDAGAARDFLPDERVGAFNGNVTAAVSEQAVSQYMAGAERIAARAAQNLGRVIGCDPQSAGREGCLEALLGGFARRLHRRPLLPAEVDAYRALHASALARGDGTRAARLVLQAMLQSPGFLYHDERINPRTSDGKVARLDDHSLAARLSYFLWHAPPDPVLLAAVDAGELARADGLERQARRLLANPRAAAVLVEFHREWLGIDELAVVEVSPALARHFPASLRADMKAETAAFVQHVLARNGGSLETLLTAPFSLLNARLAAHYGVKGPTGTELQETMLDARHRGGVLTQGAFLAAHHSYVRRGKLVREGLLCQEVPLPPPDVNTTLSEPKPGQSPREVFEEHMSNPSCSGCHRLMDPIGFAFDHFDEIGRFRTTHAGTNHAVVATGALLGTRDVDGPVVGAPDLVRRLAGSQEVHECASRQALVFALGRLPGSADECSLREVAQAFRAARLDLRELFRAVVRTRAFSHVAVTN